MRKSFFKHYICTMSLLLGMTSCSWYDTEDKTIYDRTVLVYMAADNNLSYSTSNFAQQDLNEMIEAAGDIPGNSRLIVYIDDTKLPRILSIEQQKGRRPIAKVVNEYTEEHNSGDAETLHSFIEWTTNNYPAESYGLVLWSHGDAWMPAKAPAQKVVCLDSNSGNSWMEIADIAEVLSDGSKMEFILFDACFMQSIEVAYELRHAAKHIVASPAEIPAPGAPYSRIVKAMFAQSNSAHNIAEEYYQEYNEGNITIPGLNSETFGVCLSVVDCDELEMLAEVTKEMLAKYANTQESVDLKGAQRYFIPTSSARPYFYDMNGYMKRLITDSEDYNLWKSVFDTAIPYKRTTAHWYSDYSGKEMVDLENYSGISCYVPRNTSNRTKLNTAFLNTAWCRATEWRMY